MTKVKVFEVGTEGGGLTIWRTEENGEHLFLYNHNEFDPTDSGLDINKTDTFKSFRRAFKFIHNRYEWHNHHLLHIHEEYKNYVIKKLLEKLNASDFNYWNKSQKSQIEEKFHGKFLCDNKDTDLKQRWIFIPGLGSGRTNQILLDELIEAALSIDPKIKSYFITYPYFINFFKDKEYITLHEIVIGISFIYSWMPTILKSIDINDEKTLVHIINQAKQGGDLGVKDLEYLKSVFNNSLVGTSKLLHFVNPEKFAIWDSRVYRSIFNEEPHGYKVEKPETYLGYLDLLHQLKKEVNFTKFHTLINQNFDYDVTAIRALEISFFYKKS